MEHTPITRREKEKVTQWEKITKSEKRANYLFFLQLDDLEALVGPSIYGSAEKGLVVTKGFGDETIGTFEEVFIHPFLESEAENEGNHHHQEVLN